MQYTVLVNNSEDYRDNGNCCGVFDERGKAEAYARAMALHYATESLIDDGNPAPTWEEVDEVIEETGDGFVIIDVISLTLAYLAPTLERRFIVVFDGTYEPRSVEEQTENVEIGWFCEDKGYNPADLEKVESLELQETIGLDDDHQLITRVA